MKVFLVSILVVAVLGDNPPPPQYPTPSYKPQPKYPAPSPYKPVEDYPPTPPKYDYGYDVSDGYSGADFGQQESRDGYLTEGSYRVALPDGRIQTVTYKSEGGSGFVADVQYEGEPQYPKYEPKYPAPQPKYPAPQPKYPAPQPKYPAPQPKYPAPQPKYPAPQPKYPAPPPKYPSN